MATEKREMWYQTRIRALEEEVARLSGNAPIESYVSIPAIGLICGVRAYHQMGGWQGLAPELPYQLGTPDGTTWIAHPDFNAKRVKIEAKRHVHRQDMPAEVETFMIEMSAFEEVFIRGQKVVTYSVDGLLTVAKSETTTPRQILTSKGLDPMDYFVALDQSGEMTVFDDLDQIVTLKQNDRFYTEALGEVDTVSDDEPGTVLEAEAAADRYKTWVARNQRRAKRRMA